MVNGDNHETAPHNKPFVERLLGRGRLGTVNRDVARLAEIRIPANKSLELEIEDILFRPPGRPSRKPLVRYEAKSLPSGEESEYYPSPTSG